MTIYLGMGSNLGDRREALRRALAALDGRGCRHSCASRRPSNRPPCWRPARRPSGTGPSSISSSRPMTDRAPTALLAELKRIEATLGRGPHERWSPRPIDIDILLWDERTLASRVASRSRTRDLAERNFVLTPLVALRPDLRAARRRDRNTLLERSRALGHNIPLWMGIVNLTPDSFSDGGRLCRMAAIEAHIDAMIAAGAQILDFGAPVDAARRRARAGRRGMAAYRARARRARAAVRGRASTPARQRRHFPCRSRCPRARARCRHDQRRHRLERPRHDRPGPYEPRRLDRDAQPRNSRRCRHPAERLRPDCCDRELARAQTSNRGPMTGSTSTA